MRFSTSLVFFLIILSVIAGYLLASAPFSHSIYEHYNFLKDWKFGGLIVFTLLLSLYAVQSLIQKMLSKSLGVIVNVTGLFLAIAAMVYSYMDSMNHGLPAGNRFFVGIYLFWLGWLVICIYLLLSKKINKSLEDKVGVNI